MQRDLSKLSCKVPSQTEPEEGKKSETSLDTWNVYTVAYFGPKSRTVTINGDIDEEVCVATCSQLLELSALDSVKPITVYINTCGGSSLDGFAIYDIMRLIPNPIIGIAYGKCYSIGLVLLLGTDLRIATPNTYFHYHQPLIEYASVNSGPEMFSLNESYQRIREVYDTTIRKHTNIPGEVWDREFNGSTSKYFTADEAKAYGFLHEIIQLDKQVNLQLTKEGWSIAWPSEEKEVGLKVAASNEN